MAQTWENLLFAHWPLAAATLAPRIPADLALDTRDGTAWLAITPFRLTGLRLRGLPAIPGLSGFPEINVRTYVIRDGRPGVFFFSLDAGSRLAVAAARRWYRLPYHHARFSIDHRDGRVTYASRRATGSPAEFSVVYEPTGAVSPATRGSLAWWLTERYSLYTAGSSGLYRADIEHQPWPLQPARVEIARNTMADGLGVDVRERPPVTHFAARLDVRVGPLRRVHRAYH